MHSRQLRLALILDSKVLYLRGFKVGNSLNVTSLIRHVGGLFGAFMTSWNLLNSTGQLNCEETITRISVALSCLSWGCFCSWDSVSNVWWYATDVKSYILIF